MKLQEEETYTKLNLEVVFAEARNFCCCLVLWYEKNIYNMLMYE